MILIDSIKYSCIECIRGHRSSLCRHHTRPLLQVRSKGRPNVAANGNPNHRIAVFAEQIEEDSPSSSELEGCGNGGCADKSSGGKNSCQEVQQQRTSKAPPPVVILKYSPKQVIDLVSGQVIGPYGEGNGGKAVGEKSCAGKKSATKSCCAAKELQPIKKESSCCGSKTKVQCKCSNKTRTINKSKILRTYLQNHLQNSEWKMAQKLSQKEQPAVTELAMVPPPVLSQTLDSTSITGPPPVSLGGIGGGGQSSLLQYPQLKTEEKTLEQSMADMPSGIYDVVSIPACSIPGSCCCDDSCTCTGCMVHGNSVDDLANSVEKNPLAQVLFSERATTTVPLTGSVGQTYPYSDLFNVNGFPKEEETEDTPSPGGACVCPPTECDCTNCETHGIINGLKLDDFFSEQNQWLAQQVQQQQLLQHLQIQNQKQSSQPFNQALIQLNDFNRPNAPFDYTTFLLNSLLNGPIKDVKSGGGREV